MSENFQDGADSAIADRQRIAKTSAKLAEALNWSEPSARPSASPVTAAPASIGSTGATGFHVPAPDVGTQRTIRFLAGIVGLQVLAVVTWFASPATGQGIMMLTGIVLLLAGVLGHVFGLPRCFLLPGLAPLAASVLDGLSGAPVGQTVGWGVIAGLVVLGFPWFYVSLQLRQVWRLPAADRALGMLVLGVSGLIWAASVLSVLISVVSR